MPPKRAPRGNPPHVIAELPDLSDYLLFREINCPASGSSRYGSVYNILRLRYALLRLAISDTSAIILPRRLIQSKIPHVLLPCVIERSTHNCARAGTPYLVIAKKDFFEALHDASDSEDSDDESVDPEIPSNNSEVGTNHI